MFVVRPGAASAPKNLRDCLLEIRDRRNESVRAEIERRKKLGVPDGDSDLKSVAMLCERAGEYAKAGHGADAKDAIESALAHLSDWPEIDEEKPAESLGMVRVKLRAVSQSVLSEFVSEVASTETNSAALDTYRRFVARTVAAVIGLEDEEGPVEIKAQGEALDDDALDLLDANGLIVPLMIAGRGYQDLTGEEKKLFGSQQRAT